MFSWRDKTSVERRTASWKGGHFGKKRGATMHKHVRRAIAGEIMAHQKGIITALGHDHVYSVNYIADFRIGNLDTPMDKVLFVLAQEGAPAWLYALLGMVNTEFDDAIDYMEFRERNSMMEKLFGSSFYFGMKRLSRTECQYAGEFIPHVFRTIGEIFVDRSVRMRYTYIGSEKWLIHTNWTKSGLYFGLLHKKKRTGEWIVNGVGRHPIAMRCPTMDKIDACYGNVTGIDLVEWMNEHWKGGIIESKILWECRLSGMCQYSDSAVSYVVPSCNMGILDLLVMTQSEHSTNVNFAGAVLPFNFLTAARQYCIPKCSDAWYCVLNNTIFRDADMSHRGTCKDIGISYNEVEMPTRLKMGLPLCYNVIDGLESLFSLAGKVQYVWPGADVLPHSAAFGLYQFTLVEGGLVSDAIYTEHVGAMKIRTTTKYYRDFFDASYYVMDESVWSVD